MNEKKITPLIYVHMGLMNVCAIISVVSTVVMFVNHTNIPFTSILISFLTTFSIIFGLIYLSRGYMKEVAMYYKTFLFLIAVTTAIQAYAVMKHTASWLSVTLLFLKIISLIVLTFTENMGKKTTWYVYYILLAIDLIYGILFPPLNLSKALQFTTVLSRLLLTGSIGLMIHGKYTDKEARGAK